MMSSPLKFSADPVLNEVIGQGVSRTKDILYDAATNKNTTSNQRKENVNTEQNSNNIQDNTKTNSRQMEVEDNSDK